MAFNKGARVRVSTKLSEGQLHAFGLMSRREKVGTVVEMLMPEKAVKAYMESPIYKVVFDGEEKVMLVNGKLLEVV